MLWLPSTKRTEMKKETIERKGKKKSGQDVVGDIFGFLKCPVTFFRRSVSIFQANFTMASFNTLLQTSEGHNATKSA
jgi:hypothetical protein